ncbi:hypothetical protein RFI_20171 [Reticulomyxa filosa]|uniref:Uncharacterized protein n=1 Tax=Reticulomyxa filosa TaxID=46433 RepID=X6MT44_RETFI|nr:hypothetical protein RFI_20171 [Reticulomyxa filosa]|eukprot:ETO17158.1 hypothetical protein RFI_20171 [Reticulomyxa filosa]
MVTVDAFLLPIIIYIAVVVLISVCFVNFLRNMYCNSRQEKKAQNPLRLSNLLCLLSYLLASISNTVFLITNKEIRMGKGSSIPLIVWFLFTMSGKWMLYIICLLRVHYTFFTTIYEYSVNRLRAIGGLLGVSIIAVACIFAATSAMGNNSKSPVLWFILTMVAIALDILCAIAVIRLFAKNIYQLMITFLVNSMQSIRMHLPLRKRKTQKAKALPVKPVDSLPSTSVMLKEQIDSS